MVYKYWSVYIYVIITGLYVMSAGTVFMICGSVFVYHSQCLLKLMCDKKKVLFMTFDTDSLTSVPDDVQQEIVSELHNE